MRVRGVEAHRDTLSLERLQARAQVGQLCVFVRGRLFQRLHFSRKLPFEKVSSLKKVQRFGLSKESSLSRFSKVKARESSLGYDGGNRCVGQRVSGPLLLRPLPVPGLSQSPVWVRICGNSIHSERVWARRVYETFGPLKRVEALS